MKVGYAIPEYLNSHCAHKYPLCKVCPEAVKQAPSGRWYITMGHAGFNTVANNGNGYATDQKAMQTILLLLGA